MYFTAKYKFFTANYHNRRDKFYITSLKAVIAVKA